MFKDGFEYGIDLVTVGTVKALVDDLLLNVGQGAAGLPPGTPLTGEEGVVGGGEEEPVVVLGEGLTASAVEGVEVLGEAETGMLPCLDQLILMDEEPPLLNVVPFKGEVLAIVSHSRLQIGVGLLYQSVNELPNTYRNDGYAKVSHRARVCIIEKAVTRKGI